MMFRYIKALYSNHRIDDIFIDSVYEHTPERKKTKNDRPRMKPTIITIKN